MKIFRKLNYEEGKALEIDSLITFGRCLRNSFCVIVEFPLFRTMTEIRGLDRVSVTGSAYFGIMFRVGGSTCIKTRTYVRDYDPFPYLLSQ